MSRKIERREERRKEWEEQQRLDNIERSRRASLTMYERIEEFVKDEELRVILHKIAEQCGLEN